MAIEFRCTQCGKLLRTGDDTAGKQAKCPACGTVLTIPEPGTVATGPSPPLPASPLQPEGGLAGPQPAGAGASQPWQAAANPYQSPTGASMPPLGEPSAVVRSRVSGPAIALMVTGGIGIVGQILGILANALQFAVVPMQGPQGNNAVPALFSGGIGIFFGVIGIMIGALILYGAMQMKDLRSYSLSMTSAIVAMIPCLSPCCLLGLPFGIWAIVVISSPEVKSAFRG